MSADKWIAQLSYAESAQICAVTTDKRKDPNFGQPPDALLRALLERTAHDSATPNTETAARTCDSRVGKTEKICSFCPA